MKKKRLIQVLILAFVLPLVVILLSIGTRDTGADFYEKDLKNYSGQEGNLKVALLESSGLPTTMTVSVPENYVVRIQNQADVDQFVRVMIFPTSKEASGTAQQSLPLEVVQGIDTTKWLDGEDGYYYSSAKVKIGESVNLFDKVAYAQPGNLTLDVKVEAITAEKENFVKAWWQGTVPTSGTLQTIYTQLRGEAE